MAYNPKSLKNLTPWKKGQNGGSVGRHKTIEPYLRKILNQKKIEELSFQEQREMGFENKAHYLAHKLYKLAAGGEKAEIVLKALDKIMGAVDGKPMQDLNIVATEVEYPELDKMTTEDLKLLKECIAVKNEIFSKYTNGED